MTYTIPLRRIRALDGLRGCAIALVLLAHLAGTAGFPIDRSEAAGRLGDLGVKIFFVLSGYLITRLLHQEHRRTRTIDLRRFYIRRALRIFPAAYTFVLAIAVARSFDWIQVDWRDVVASATYTMNFRVEPGWWLGHTWSLSVEEQFYVLWPLLVLLAPAMRRGTGALLICAVIPVARAAILAFVPAMGEGVERSFLTACDGFAVGAFVALARERLEQIPLYQRLVAWPATPALAIALALPLNLLQHHPLVYYALVQPVLYAGIALVVHHCVYRPEGGAGRLLARSALVRLGAVSYSLYLWQQPFLNWRSTGVLQTFPVNLLLAGACASLSYYFVERTALNVRERWFASDDSGSAAVEVEEAGSAHLLAN